MMPNMDPRAMKSMMAKMGIKSEEISATRVTIECDDRQIVIANPQVTRIEMQGVTSFQVTGEISESQNVVQLSVGDDDIALVKEKTGISDDDKVKKALSDANGDIARAILDLTKKD